VNWEEEKTFAEVYLTDSTLSRDTFIATVDGRTAHSLNDLLLQLRIVDNFHLPKDHQFIPYLSEKDIDDRIARLNLLKCFAGSRLDTDRLCEWISSLYDIAFDFDHPLGAAGNMTILGKLTYDPFAIQVNVQLKPDIHRWRFTLVHEIAHVILHYHLLAPFQYALQDTAGHFNFNVAGSDFTIKRMELQANLMAAQILLPTNIFLHRVAHYFKEQRIHTGFLFVDHQPQNQQLLLVLLEKVSQEFQVSMEVARLRLKRLRLLKDKYNQTIGSVLKEQGYPIW
jgi:Zn-dependent peptidase ImmA (M78 family)